MKLLLKIIPFLIFIPFAQAQVFEVSYGKETSTRTLLIPADNSKATVLLYIGGNGMVGLGADGSTSHRHTFVRSREYWKKYGINAVLVDSPNDLGSASKGLNRNTEDHLGRVESVAQFYKNKMKQPVWIFGHSNGTVTVAALVNKNPEIQKTLSGLIIAGTHKGETMPNNITLPLLAIHHPKDGCWATPFTASEELVKLRDKSLVTKFIVIDGGVDQGDPCQARSYHGFNGTEDQLIEAAAKFILAN
jgi:hypothetical protein